MKIKIKKLPTTVVLSVDGKLQGSDAMQMSRKIEAMTKYKQNAMVVDLRGISYLDSRWLGVFVYCWKALRAEGKELTFMMSTGDVFNFFRDANLDTLFRIVHSPQELGIEI